MEDATAQSWVASANAPDSDFPLQNLPFGVYAAGDQEDWRIGVAIGDAVLDLRAASRQLRLPDAQELQAPALDEFLALGRPAWRAVRGSLQQALREGSADRKFLEPLLLPQAQVRMKVPAHIGDYTDFFTSIHHATRVGALLRPEQPLLPNYRWVPIAYHGRSSSIVISGSPVRRPWGQLAARGATQPEFGVSRRLDYELELAAMMGPGNTLGVPIPVDQAEEHVFGLCLLNDWSARDVQAWEYQPLGPFLAKNFATTISPWMVPLDALEPFRVPWQRPPEDPRPLPYLDAPALHARGAMDLRMEVRLRSARMVQEGAAGMVLSRSNFRDAYWCLAQMVAHHTVTGCNLSPGDLLATGTQSGPKREESGCLLELTQGGKEAITLPTGEERRFLEDGDEVTLRAWCERPGYRRIGFGTCVGTILPAR